MQHSLVSPAPASSSSYLSAYSARNASSDVTPDSTTYFACDTVGCPSILKTLRTWKAHRESFHQKSLSCNAAGCYGARYNSSRELLYHLQTDHGLALERVGKFSANANPGLSPRVSKKRRRANRTDSASDDEQRSHADQADNSSDGQRESSEKRSISPLLRQIVTQQAQHAQTLDAIQAALNNLIQARAPSSQSDQSNQPSLMADRAYRFLMANYDSWAAPSSPPQTSSPIPLSPAGATSPRASSRASARRSVQSSPALLATPFVDDALFYGPMRDQGARSPDAIPSHIFETEPNAE